MNEPLTYAVFIAFTAYFAYLSRGTLNNLRSHGLYRFIAWELTLVLVLRHFHLWTVDPFSTKRIVSWVLLTTAVALTVHAVLLLRSLGRPMVRPADYELVGHEKTRTVVRSGAYHYIRHPMYTALLGLTWGVFLKEPTWASAALAGGASLSLLVAAMCDERECLDFFGNDYAAYMRRSKRFVPFVF